MSGFCARWYFFRDAAGIVGEGGGWDRGRKLASSRAPLGRRAPCFCFTTGSGHPTAGYRGRVCTVKASEKTAGKTYSCTIMVYLDLLLDRVCLNLKNVEPAREAIKWSFIFQICFLSWKDIISHCTTRGAFARETTAGATAPNFARDRHVQGYLRRCTLGTRMPTKIKNDPNASPESGHGTVLATESRVRSDGRARLSPCRWSPRPTRARLNSESSRCPCWPVGAARHAGLARSACTSCIGTWISYSS